MLSNLGLFMGLSFLFLLFSTPSVAVVPNGYYFYCRKRLIIFTNSRSVAIEIELTACSRYRNKQISREIFFFPRNESADACIGKYKAFYDRAANKKNPINVK